MMNDKHNSINNYVSVWNESDETKIKQMLAGCVTSNVSYCDPFTDVVQGVDALTQVMLNVSQSFPNVKHELTGELSIHHNFCYYRWLARINRAKAIPGLDYVEFAPDDRIAKVVSFTDPANWTK